jgi:hypothetical protein
MARLRRRFLAIYKRERIIEPYADQFKDLTLRHMRGEDLYDTLQFSGF